MLKIVSIVIAGLLSAHAASAAGSYGPELEYSFNTGTGPYVYDHSDNSNTGTIHNAAWDADGRSGYALRFDGDDYVNVPHSQSTDIRSEITVAAWIKSAYSSRLATVLDKDGSYVLQIRNGTVYWRLNATSDETLLKSSSTIGNGVWTYIACTYDGSFLKIFVNGKLDASVGLTGLIIGTNDDLQIGRRSANYSFFNGLIDELKIFDNALPGEQIERMYITMLDYTFSTGSGPDVYDESGYLNRGTVNGAAWTADGKRNNALAFDGNDDVVIVPNASSLNPTDEITVSAWVKGDYAYTGNLLHTVLGKTQSYFLSVLNNGRIYWIVSKSGGGSSNTLSNGAIDSDWNHIVCTYDGLQARIYINGVLDRTLNSSGSIKTADSDLQIGRYGTVYPFYGTIDEVKVFNAALATDQVERLFISESDAPVLDYDFDAGFGATVNDASGYGNTGALGAASPEWTLYGKVNGGLDFNGAGTEYNCIVVPSSASLIPMYELSVSVWVKASYPPSGISYDVIEKGNDFCLAVKDDGVDWQVGNRYLDCSHTMNNGGWTHVVCTYNGLESKVYVDGTLRATDSYDGTVNPGTGDVRLNIGFFDYHRFSTSYSGRIVWDEPFDGTMDELKMYPKALTANEVAVLWNNGAGKAAPDAKEEPVVHMDAPDELRLTAFPTPFVSDTRFTATLPASGDAAVRAELGIFTNNGAVVRTLVDGIHAPGETVCASWDGRDDRGNRVRNGVYFYKLVACGKEKTGSIIVAD